MKPTATRILAGILSFCLLLALYGCSDAFPTSNDQFAIDTVEPVYHEGTGTASSTTETTINTTGTTGESTEPSETTTTATEPTPTKKPADESTWREPAKNNTDGVADMDDEEWKEYEQDDPQYPPHVDEPEPPVEDTLPSVAPPSPTTTTPAPPTTTTTTAATTSPTTVPGPGTTTTTTTAPPTTTTTTPPTNPKPSTGWYYENGKTYFYNNGSPVTGWQTMGGVRYYFDGSGVLSSKVGIDVSTYQGVVDWNAVKASGVEFAFIRVGFRGWGDEGTLRTDAYFERNIKGAIAAGIDCGVYFYTQAITTAEAVEEARYVLNLIKGYKLTYPVAFDTEYLNEPDARTNKAGLTTQDRTNFAAAFCKTIKDAGYYPMIYANKSWLENNLYTSQLSQYDVWMAQFASTATYKGNFNIWQYTSTGSVSGIKGNVDRNVGLVDYADIIRKNGWNHL